MAAKDKSIFEQVTLEANDQSQDVDIRAGVVSIDYYEDIFSPTITAQIVVFNTGDSITGKDGKLQSIYNGLPLRGGERLSLKIKKNSEENAGLDFSETYKDYMYVSSITNVLTESQREAFTLNLVSREAITNETVRVPIRFATSSTIDTSVKKILTDYLKTEKEMDIEPTSNTYGFIGNLKKPFNLLVWLASKGVPEESGDGSAGFVFFQTQDGYHFKSIDSLINQEPKATYTYTEVNKSQIERNNDFNILRYSTNKNQDLLQKLRLGAYASYVATFDFYNGRFNTPEESKFILSKYKSKVKNLGKELELPSLSNDAQETLGDIPSRIMSMVIDRGTVETGVSREKNADPMRYQAQAIMKYNTLFTQELHMQVPLNTNLKAGDVIKCQFPKISTGSEEYDDEQSGLYLIKELCHHFDSEKSETSMKLLRDTFGLYGVNNDNGGK